MNLARVLRPKLFCDVVGQDLVKSILQNSLFLNRICPVYLLAGDRGCGKTTLARIFASSLNCSLLKEFQLDYKKVVPCLECESCKNMLLGSHPDFFEIDAASNNGVENIRQILESAMYQPSLGEKRIFLLDEAHMLSKSAFNALLKILEEPPKTVVFILATTEINKILPTIKSRSILGIFSKIEPTLMFNFLEKTAADQNIKISQDGLWAITKLSQGCLRDAINLLEQASLSNKIIDKNLTEQMFCFSPTKDVVSAVELIAKDNMHELKNYLKSCFVNYSAVSFFESLQELLSNLTNAKMNIKIDDTTFYGYESSISEISKSISLEQILNWQDLAWQEHKTFLATTQKELFLNYLLTKMLDKKKTLTSRPQSINSEKKDLAILEKESITDKAKTETKSISDKPALENRNFKLWQSSISEPEIKKDALLHSILTSVVDIELNESNEELSAITQKNNRFFQSILADNMEILIKLLQKNWPVLKKIQLKESTQQQPASTKNESANKPNLKTNFQSKNKYSTPGVAIPNTSDKIKWPKLNLLLEHFPGKVVIEKKVEQP